MSCRESGNDHCTRASSLVFKLPPWERIAMVRSNSSGPLQLSNFSIQSRERTCVKIEPDWAASLNEALSACLRLSRMTWKKWSSCHRRSLVETKMSCLKYLLVMVRTFEHQSTELNICLDYLTRKSNDDGTK